MSIYRRTGDKHFQAKWNDPASGCTKQKSTKTNIRLEAERFAVLLEKELNSGTYVEQTKTKRSTFRERYETEVVPGLAEKTAEAIWQTVVQLGEVSGDTAENRKKSEKPEKTQVIRAKESKNMRAQGFEPWTYGLKVIEIVQYLAIKQRFLYLNDIKKGTI
ncbi:hypothetical protein [Gimesia sp.]|uniref:hypothetical protein n=1 Tax=Gimesia sp. TaxID=2024833 RepID=UPI003A90AA14